MIITVLCEDKPIQTLKNEHGLSIYIQTNKHRILFDTGKSDVFINNAKALNVDLSTIDTVVLSHAHYDHGDGLLPFFSINRKANVYMHEAAFHDYFHEKRYIGLNKQIHNFQNRIIFIKEQISIDEELTLLTLPTTISNNSRFFQKQSGEIAQDDFEHELYLEIAENNKKAVFTGCGHKGIPAIAKLATQRNATSLIGGFHLTEDLSCEKICSIAKELSQYLLIYYTGHCTSPTAMHLLKKTLGHSIRDLSVGRQFVVGNHAEIAGFLFRQGYNCSQSVLGAFADELELDFDTAAKISCSFGGGMGRMREVCGAVSGMLLVNGLLNGYVTPETGQVKHEHYKQVQALANSFREKHGSIICRELLGGRVSNDPSPSARTKEFYKTRPCERLIMSAASIIEDILFQSDSDST